jgi:hypothetical protein
MAAILSGAPSEWWYAAVVIYLTCFVGPFLELVRDGRPPIIGAARVGDRGLEVNGDRIARRDDIIDAKLFPQLRAELALTLRDGRTLVVVIRSLDDARRALDALGRGPANATAAFSLESRALTSPPIASALFAAFLATLTLPYFLRGHVGSAPGILLTTTLLAILTVIAVVPTHARVGTDGIVVRWLSTTRMLSLSDVTSVEATAYGISLRRADGSCTELRVGYLVPRPGTVGALAERIDGVLSGRGAAADALVATTLSRGTQSARDWVYALRQLCARELGFRAPAVVADRLWPLVEDAAADPSTRVAAAVALAPTLDDESRARVRVAASASASPKLRVALEAAADDDVERVVDALTQLQRDRSEGD